jgi:phosphoribosylglycinamide formyltransferase-1
MVRKRVAILISGRGSNMVALIEARRINFPAEIALVCPTSPPRRIEARGGRRHQAAVVDHRKFGKDREAFERALQDECRRTRSNWSAWRASCGC